MIRTREPSDWRALQEEVARILGESGLTVQIERRVSIARGQVVVDVYAEEVIKGRKYSIVCECKQWKSRIPQNVVHGFRTVIGDLGANLGYIIGSAGFQSGAVEAADLTNIKLLTWEEFQTEFEETWLNNFFYPGIGRELDPLFTYCEPILPKWFADLSEENKSKYIGLNEAYEEFGWMMMSCSHYVRVLQERPAPPLPMINHLSPDSSIRKNVPKEVLDAVAYGDFYDHAVPFGKSVIRQFREIRATVVKDDLGMEEDEP